jgi:hypothetical protein
MTSILGSNIKVAVISLRSIHINDHLRGSSRPNAQGASKYSTNRWIVRM